MTRILDFKHLTQENLDRVKRLHPNDRKLQELTLAELKQHAQSRDPQGHHAQPATPQEVRSRQTRSLPTITDCEYALGGVAIDAFLVITGAVGLHGKISKASVEEVVDVIRPVLSHIEETAELLSEAAHTGNKAELAKGMFRIGKLIYSGGMLEAIYKAITKSLEWWDMILYAVVGLGEVVAAFLTDGAALIAEVIVELASIGFLVSDLDKAYEACKPDASGNTPITPLVKIQRADRITLESYGPPGKAAQKRGFLAPMLYYDHYQAQAMDYFIPARYTLIMAGEFLSEGTEFLLKYSPEPTAVNNKGKMNADMKGADVLDVTDMKFKPQNLVRTKLKAKLCHSVRGDGAIHDGELIHLMGGSPLNYLSWSGPNAFHLSGQPTTWLIRKAGARSPY